MTIREILACAPASRAEALGEAAVAIGIVIGLPLGLPFVFFILGFS
ncbi:MAG: hypothetical protein ACJA1L_000348 [Paracoccaceae bacterium]|jgi:hypothetical protein